jgi:hypothetical protein
MDNIRIIPINNPEKGKYRGEEEEEISKGAYPHLEDGCRIQ